MPIPQDDNDYLNSCSGSNTPQDMKDLVDNLIDNSPNSKPAAANTFSIKMKQAYPENKTRIDNIIIQ